MKTNQKRGGKPLVIVLSVLVLMLAVIGILFGMALSDPNEPITPNTQTGTATVKLIKAAVSGKPARLTADEVNAVLAQKLAQSEQSRIRGVRLTVNDDNTVDAYLPVVYKGIKLGVSANLTFSWDTAAKQLIATVHSMKIGRLPVNSARMLSRIKELLPQGVSAQDNVLRIDSELVGAHVLGSGDGLNITGISVAERNFVVNITGNLDILKNYIAEHLKSLIGYAG